jgi:hypothetical protein
VKGYAIYGTAPKRSFCYVALVEGLILLMNPNGITGPMNQELEWSLELADGSSN